MFCSNTYINYTKVYIYIFTKAVLVSLVHVYIAPCIILYFLGASHLETQVAPVYIDLRKNRCMDPNHQAGMMDLTTC